ncbi:MAG TPA: hypothetical protein VFU36_13025 [Jatrophihabitans sp.]|nr:hypothetical protein [Jatrophihabitans sp.]
MVGVTVIGVVLFLLAHPDRYVRRHLRDTAEPSGALLAEHQPAD